MKKFLIQHEKEFMEDDNVPHAASQSLSNRLILQWTFHIAKGMQYLARMHIMHLAVLLALLGTIGGGVMFGRGLTKEPVEMMKVVDQGLLALLCIVFLVCAIRSFIAARANRSD